MTDSSSEVLPANTAEWAARPRHGSTAAVPAFLRTPKGQVLAVFVVLVAIAMPAESGWVLFTSTL
jgi:hypothetical protein